jgi:hypothetical protein
MRKSVVISVVAFGLLSVIASADDWILAIESNEARVFVRENSLRRIEGYRRIWVLYDYKTPLEAGFRSTVFLYEFDCKNDRVRSLNHNLYGGVRGTGELIGADSIPTEWNHVVPGTIIELLTRSVCLSPDH